jgi:hypothetical protein
MFWGAVGKTGWFTRTTEKRNGYPIYIVGPKWDQVEGIVSFFTKSHETWKSYDLPKDRDKIPEDARIDPYWIKNNPELAATLITF